MLGLQTLVFSHPVLSTLGLLVGFAAVGMALTSKLPAQNDFAKLLFSLGFMDANANLKGPVGGALGTLAMYDQLRDSQFSIAGVGNAADTTDDTLFSTSLQANELAKNGDEYVLEACGSTAANGNNKTIKVFFGATAVLSSGVITSNAKKWTAYVRVKRSAAGTQIANGEFTVDGTATTVNLTTPAEDLTGAVTAKVTGASPTTGAASDVLGNDWSVVRRGLAS